ncbi:MAG: hypothetical protein JOY77_11910 [Alphaproteobacteria bacterium]|nr:hypothetical protein [Alphaproteobacteria bacterium]
MTAICLSACGRPPGAHATMTACYAQLDKQAPGWRSEAHQRHSKMGTLVPRYILECMQAERFKLRPLCSQMDERCYTQEPRFWERL